MSLTQEQISHLAKLTGLKGSNIGIENVIASFEVLSKADTKTVHTVRRSGNNTLLLRKDEVIASESLPNALLNCSGQKKAAHQIILSGIMYTE
jgi:Asp-tRNA(Asn)/Glu-tRNA(Gln) amidotransferase C subunit